MAQFQVYRLPSGPLVVDVQSDLVGTPTRAVAALTPEGGEAALKGLQPVFEVAGERLALRMTDLASVPSWAVAGPPLADLSRDRDAVMRAVDILFLGF